MELPTPPMKRVVVVVAFGAGILIGTGATWWALSHRLTQNVVQLTNSVQVLNQKVDSLQECVSQLLSTKSTKPVVPDNTREDEDDDDVYEDAYGGPVSWVGGLSSDQVSSSTKFDAVSENGMIGQVLPGAGNGLCYADVDRLLDGNDTDKREAFHRLSERQQKLNHDVNFIWRLAKATYFMSQNEARVDKAKQKSLVYQALEYATQALKMDDRNSNVHKWYAITLGSIGDYESISVKIQNGFRFKTHIEKAIELNPKDPSAHYLLGRWCFGVYMLSWVERKMAATLFAIPPSATVDEALEHFLEADRLNPGKWKENMLFIAKCYIQKRDYIKAVDWLDKANIIPVCGQEDENYQKEVVSLLKQYSVCRSRSQCE